MHEREQELVGLLSKQCTNMEDVHKLLKSLFKSTLEEMLEAEMDEHLGYQKHDLSGNNSGNSRNGYGKKTLQTELGETELRVPRDRNGTFAPQVV
ncbi:transposase, partial [Sporomusa ovata]